MKRIVILISGRGSNMRSIALACKNEKWPAQVVAVIANRPDAAGLAFAAERGVATAVVNHKAFTMREAFDAAMAQAIDAHAPDVVVLAGFDDPTHVGAAAGDQDDDALHEGPGV